MALLKANIHLSQGNNLTGYKGFMELLDSSANSRVWIIDKKGDILVMSKGEFCGGEEKAPLKIMTGENTTIEKVIGGQEIILEGKGMFYAEPMVTVGVPVYNANNEIAGGVFLHSPVKGITDTIDKAFLVLVAGIFLAILFSVLMGWVYSIIIAKPLKLMNNAAIEMTRGNYGIRTNVRQNDEIGQLSSSLDMLSSMLGFSIDQLFQEKGKLNDIIASISEGIIAFDTNMKLTNYNQSLLRLYGYSTATDISDSIKRDLDEQDLLGSFTEIIENGESRSLVREWSIYKLKYTLSPVKNNSDEITGVVAQIQDISESERLEKMRMDFVANVSHELRTPLTLIKGSIEALIDEAVTEVNEVKKYHNRIFNEASVLERLVNDLLDLSRLQSGKLSFDFDLTDICALVSDTVNSFRSIAQNKGIEIVFQAAENVPLIKSDYDRIKQLLIIFFDNAVKYSNQNTKIELSMEVKDYIFIKIKDGGIGIPKEDLPFVWERFYKVDKARSNPQHGTGLGLSIAKHIIEVHQGVIRLESELNTGTTVILGLPFVKE
jgi:two-component system sensor histidine kinase ResE